MKKTTKLSLASVGALATVLVPSTAFADETTNTETTGTEATGALGAALGDLIAGLLPGEDDGTGDTPGGETPAPIGPGGEGGEGDGTGDTPGGETPAPIGPGGEGGEGDGTGTSDGSGDGSARLAGELDTPKAPGPKNPGTPKGVTPYQPQGFVAQPQGVVAQPATLANTGSNASSAAILAGVLTALGTAGVTYRVRTTPQVAPARRRGKHAF